MNHVGSERRQKERMTLRCPVQIFVMGEIGVRHATTVNISSRGIYYLSDHAYSPGEKLCSRVELAPRLGADGSEVYIDCVLEVVRVEAIGEGYGLGCRILRYVLRRGGPNTFAKVGELEWDVTHA